jgi:RND family efflux transporter MFP subunit
MAWAGCGAQPSAPTATPAAAAGGAPAAEPVAGNLERVTTGHPARKTLTLTSVQPAAIEAFEETPLFSKIAGYVDKVHVDIGDRVKKDQVLVTLWAPELLDDRNEQQALVEQADAEVRQAEAGVAATKATVATAEAAVAGQQAGLTRAQGLHERWKSESERIQQLVAAGVVTQKLADETLNEFQAAAGSLEEVQAGIVSAEAVLTQTQANVRKAEADLAAAQARLKVAHAALARAETMLGYLEVKAPYDGVITARNVDTRHYVHPAGGGQAQPLLVIAHMETVRVYASIPETEAELVTGGVDGADPVIVTVQALGNRTFEGNVTRTGWTLDPANRSLKVEIDLPNPDGLLRPGMYALARLQLDQVADALTVPNAALAREGAAVYVCTVENGTVSRKPVEVGLRVGDDVQVRSGVTEQDLIVLARAGGLKDGQRVDVIQQ